MLLVASLSALAGNYVTSLRPGFGTTSTSTLKPGQNVKRYELLKSYRYEIVIDAGGGEVRLTVLGLEDFLSSEGSSPQNALINITVKGSERVGFKPDRRGVYVTIIENLGDRDVFVGYARTYTREFEQDFLQDSAIVASAGALLIIIDLILKRALKGWR
ncbi:MAG: hypothetical protein QW231_03420 [Candidatus Bathyarchaeia archaeon]